MDYRDLLIIFESMLVIFCVEAWHKFFKLKSAILLRFSCCTKKLLMRKTIFLFVYLVFPIAVLSQDLLSQQKLERLFKDGIDLMEHNEYGAAREAFTEFLSIPSQVGFKKGDAEYYLSFCALNLFHGDGEKLIEDFIAH